VALHPRQMEGVVTKLQEEDEAHLVGEFWLMSSETVSGAGLSGATWLESSGLCPVGQ